MPKRGGKEHEEALERVLNSLKENGWKAFSLDGKSPDGIAVKDNEIIAVEILRKFKTERKNPEQIKKHGRYVTRYVGGTTIAAKKRGYSMFDRVLVEVV